MRRIRTNDETRLATPFRHRITAFRNRPIFPGSIFLDSMTNQGTGRCAGSGSNGRAARVTGSQATDDRARACTISGACARR